MKESSYLVRCKKNCLPTAFNLSRYSFMLLPVSKFPLLKAAMFQHVTGGVFWRESDIDAYPLLVGFMNCNVKHYTTVRSG